MSREAAAEEDFRHRMHPDQVERKRSRRAAGTSHSTTSMPKKAKKDKPNRDPRTQPSRKPKEVDPPLVEAPRGAEGGAERGGAGNSRPAKEPVPGGKEKKMEVSGQPEMPSQPRLDPKPRLDPEPRLEPRPGPDPKPRQVPELHLEPEPHLKVTPPATPPPTEEKAGTLGEGATVEEEEEEEEEEDESGDDLYRAEEEIEQAKHGRKHRKGRVEPLNEHDRAAGAEGGSSGSVDVMVNLLHYSEREWRGNTPKSALIRKGYKEVSQSFVGLRRVRGDNYCALRATLFQVFAQSTQVPSWLTEEDVTLWPEQLLAEKQLFGQWQFPTERRGEEAPEGAVEQLKYNMGLLRKRWEAVAQAAGPQERQAVCAEVFQAEEEEYGLLEALKFLMLRTASQLHARMESGADVPVFCWLLFARDSSSCPRDLLLNHLRHVGVSGGLEQVEMFLLGYALQHSIKVYRLYKAGTEEFTTYYPDDHKDWPCVCLLTEDDRHYNVPVSEADGLQVPEAPTLV